MTERTATISRRTGETDITLTLTVDGTGTAETATGIGFLDHMLTLFAKHGLFDISVKANGGGSSGQAQASRTAVARALLEAHGGNDAIRQQMLSFDRSLLVEDPRRVEPKKFKGPKARARFTKSYR